MADYALITPDGMEFELTTPGFVVDLGVPDGFGLPPVQHTTKAWYNLPGALLESIQIGPRVVTITTSILGGCSANLHTLRRALWNALRWNRTTNLPPLPSQLRYRRNGREAFLDVYYLSDVVQDQGTGESEELAGVKLIAYNPLWYGGRESGELHTQTPATVIPAQSLTASYVIGKVNGIWDALGGVGTGAVNAFALSLDGSTLYIGGSFGNWAGIANADYIAAYNLNTGAWSALGTGMNQVVRALAVGADGTLYAAGDFATAGGVAAVGIAKWNGLAWSTVGASGVLGGSSTVTHCHIGTDGALYIGGNFTSVGGVAANNVAKWNGTAWSALGTGTNGSVYAITSGSDGAIYIGGIFTTAGGTTVNRVAKWNGTTWSALSIGANAGEVRTLAMGLDGTLFAGGTFTAVGGVTCAAIAQWNGTTWAPLGVGVTAGQPYALAVAPNGDLYLGGSFTSVGGLAPADKMGVWNGTEWRQVDVDLPGNPEVYAFLVNDTYTFIGFSTSGSSSTSATSPATPGIGTATIQTRGDVATSPVITLTGPGLLQWVENTNTGRRIVFNFTMLPAEVVTIDLANKTFTSDSRGNLIPLSGLLPLSDFASWELVPDPIAANGVNRVNMFVTATTPSEQNDNNNQLSGWASITGITYLNTDAGGRLYVSIIADGGGFYHVALYDDAARSHLVGHTATYNGAGAKAIVADNASGLGGTITVDAVVGADADILAFFCTAQIEWTDQFLSADAATE